MSRPKREVRRFRRRHQFEGADGPGGADELVEEIGVAAGQGGRVCERGEDFGCLIDKERQNFVLKRQIAKGLGRKMGDIEPGRRFGRALGVGEGAAGGRPKAAHPDSIPRNYPPILCTACHRTDFVDKLRGGAGSAGRAANLSDYGEGRVNDVSKPLAAAVSIA